MLHRYLIILFAGVTLQSSGEHPSYSRWNLSSFIAYVTQPRGDQNVRRYYIYAGGTIVGLGALSWIAWKLWPKKNPEVKKVIELKESEVNLIINHLSIVSGIRNNKECTDIDKKNKDIDAVNLQFHDAIATQDYAQRAMIETVTYYLQDKEVNKAIFDLLDQSENDKQKITKTINRWNKLSTTINQTYDIEIEAENGKIKNIRKTNLKIDGKSDHFAPPLYQFNTFIALVNNVCEAIDKKKQYKIQLEKLAATKV
jgi:hypothetical protein